MRSLGVHEVSGFATLTDEELATPGLGVPMRARRRILTLAGVYARQELAAEKEKVEAKGKMLAPTSPPPGKMMTVDGKYYFASKKALREAWNDADFYNRSGAPYGDDDAGENKVVRPTYNGDPSVLTNYMNILTEEPYVAPKDPDPREHGPRVSLLIAKIRRETERDADWNLLEHPPKGYFDHEKVECCG